MRPPNPAAAARLMRSHIEVVPDPVEPDPVIPLGRLSEPPRQDPNTEATSGATTAPTRRSVALCGHCSHGWMGHGVQYGALVGWHTWAPQEPKSPKTWSEICKPPRRSPR